MRKLIIVAALLWTGSSFGQTVTNQPQLKQTPVKLQFVPPQELATKPNHPQASTANAYSAQMVVQGTTDGVNWSATVPLHSYAILAPRDAASGLPTGKRMHKPFTVTIETSAATPLLQNVKSNSIINLVTVTFNPFSKDLPAHTFVMKNVQNARHVQTPELVQFTVTFEKITWTWTDGGKTFSDDWEAR
jgi:type VI secretion system secreted protein Hcp